MYVVQDARFVKEIRGKGIGVKGGGGMVLVLRDMGLRVGGVQGMGEGA